MAHDHSHQGTHSHDGADCCGGNAPPPVDLGPPATAVDPVCGMTVATAAGTPTSRFEGKTYFFCCDGCKDTFDADPALSLIHI